MCGRFTIAVEPAELQEEFDFPQMPSDWVMRYNVSPTQPVAVITSTTNKHIEFFKWGLIPGWAQDPAIGERLTNARSETLTEKPSFHQAFQKRRCLILADGFYEWRRSKEARGGSAPFRFIKKDKKPFAFAGLWELWRSPEGEEVKSCTIITCAANPVVAAVHERMPVMLLKQDYWNWLDLSDQSSLLGLLKPYPPELMEGYPVGKGVNDVSLDRKELIEPLTSSWEGNLFR